MLDPDEIEGRIRDMMLRPLDDEKLKEEADVLLNAMAERDRRITQAFDEMLAEVDKLILLAELLEGEEPEDGDG